MLKLKQATNILLLALVVIAGGAFAAQPAPTTATPAKAAPKKAEPPKPVEREVSYADLGGYLNKRIIVHSNLGTVRSGTLTHYTQAQIDIALDGNGAQLSFTRDTIKSVTVPIAPEETQASDSAKKN
jgi:hypothetical protein